MGREMDKLRERERERKREGERREGLRKQIFIEFLFKLDSN